MGIRTGAEILDGLRDGRQIFIDGERVDDVITDRRFSGAARTMAELYDMQHDPALIDEMSYASPSTGDRVGLSFIQAASQDDLARRRVMVKHWHDRTFGMFGRAPDFINVMLAGYAAVPEYFGAYAENMQRYYELAREGDLVSTHTLTNPQVDRSRDITEQEKDLAARAVKETDAGIVIRGARMLATLGAFSDEMLVMPAPSYPLPENEEAKKFAIGFAIPVATPGMRLICRPAVVHQGVGSSLDFPLSSRLDETDAMVIFDDVLVPWDRVFLYRDVELFNALYRGTGALLHMAHQFSTKDLAVKEVVSHCWRRIHDGMEHLRSFSEEMLMNTGKTLFAQFMDFLPWTTSSTGMGAITGDAFLRRAIPVHCADRDLPLGSITWASASLHDPGAGMYVWRIPLRPGSTTIAHRPRRVAPVCSDGKLHA